MGKSQKAFLERPVRLRYLGKSKTVEERIKFEDCSLNVQLAYVRGMAKGISKGLKNK